MNMSFLNNDIQVPQPNISTGQNSASNNKTDKKVEKKVNIPKRQYERPSIGVLNVPTISKTPLADTYVRKQKEFPHTKYKVNFSKQRTQGLKPHALASIGIVVLGLIQIFKK